MKLVLIGLVMIANGFTSVSCSDNENIVDSGLAQRPEKKRKLTILPHFPKQQANGKTDKIVGKDANGNLVYECTRCTHVGHNDTHKTHQHNLKMNCFPQMGFPCKDCVNGSALSMNAVQMLKHNKEFHSALHSWTCRFCGTQSAKDKWFAHLSYYTNVTDAPVVFDGYADDTLKIAKRKYTLGYARQMVKKNESVQESTDDSSSTHASTNEAISPISNQDIPWVYHAHRVLNGTRQLVITDDRLILEKIK